MKIQCDSCEKSLASVICCADEAALCADCDSRIHAANQLVSKHQRVPFLPVSESPRCDICQEKLAFFFCLEDRALLCCNCDLSIHNANALTRKHSRFLIPGTRVSLGPIPVKECIEPVTPEVEASTYAARLSPSFSETIPQSLKSGEILRPCSHGPNTATAVRKPEATSRVPSLLPPSSNNLITPRRLQGCFRDAASLTTLASMPSFNTEHQSSALLRKSSIIEFLTDAIPGWQVEELLNLPELAGGYTSLCDGSNKAEALSLEELDWMPHCALQGNQVFVDAVREVPQLPLPQTPVLPELMPWLSRVVSSGSLKVKGNQEATPPVEMFLDAFVVPDLGTQLQSPQFLKRRRNF